MHLNKSLNVVCVNWTTNCRQSKRGNSVCSLLGWKYMPKFHTGMNFPVGFLFPVF
jgi:hypothetical protein